MYPLAWIARVLDVVFPPRADALLVREAQPGSLAALLRPELIETTRPYVTALASFMDPLTRALVREAKYHANERAQFFLAQLLREYLREIATDTYETAVIIPIPLSPARLRERGFNQCEVIARHALGSGDLPLTIDARALVRMRDTEHQARLSRAARLRNVVDAFEATRALDPHTTYLLFDDVVTTGATLGAAAKALRARGAKRILPIALAR
ncbi:MAG TPA: ComF family protein [Candidatus Paceibacterota bacterium]|nr:ComF family protein [Candidatus Paceibacterota bacterium]